MHANLRVSIGLHLIVLFAPSLHAEDFEISHPKPGVVILKATTCEGLRAHVEALVKWKRARKEIPPPITIDCANEKTLSLDISSFIPSSVQKLYGIYPACDGTNCFSASLVDAGVLDSPRYVSPAEWNYYLETRCARVTGPHQPGDLVAIRKKKSPSTFKESHGFTIIDEGLACSKNGVSGIKPCLLQSYESVLERYDVEKGNPACINPIQIPPANCRVFVNFYDCTNAGFGLPPGLLELEAKISESVMLGLPPDISQIPISVDPNESPALIAALKKSFDVQILTLKIFQFQSPLGKAVKRGDSALVQKLLVSGENPNPEGEPLVLEATLRNNLAIVRILISHGAKLDTSSEQYRNYTALEFASSLDYVDIVEYLLLQHAKINATDNLGNTPLINAASLGQEGAAKLLLKNGAQVEAKNRRGRTALHQAAASGHAKMMTLLLDAGAKIDSVDDLGWTPLMVAIEHGRMEAFRMALDKGAKINAKTRIGVTPLQLAVEFNSEEAFNELLKRNADVRSSRGGSVLPNAANKGRVDMVKTLLAMKAVASNQNDKDEALGFAAHAGHLAVAELLVAAGANKDSKNLNGDTPFVQAIAGGHLALVEYFIKIGVNPFLMSHKGLSILEFAKNAPARDKQSKAEIVTSVRTYVSQRGGLVAQREKNLEIWEKYLNEVYSVALTPFPAFPKPNFFERICKPCCQGKKLRQQDCEKTGRSLGLKLKDEISKVEELVAKEKMFTAEELQTSSVAPEINRILKEEIEPLHQELEQLVKP